MLQYQRHCQYQSQSKLLRKQLPKCLSKKTRRQEKLRRSKVLRKITLFELREDESVSSCARSRL